MMYFSFFFFARYPLPILTSNKTRDKTEWNRGAIAIPSLSKFFLESFILYFTTPPHRHHNIYQYYDPRSEDPSRWCRHYPTLRNVTSRAEDRQANSYKHDQNRGVARVADNGVWARRYQLMIRPYSDLECEKRSQCLITPEPESTGGVHHANSQHEQRGDGG